MPQILPLGIPFGGKILNLLPSKPRSKFPSILSKRRKVLGGSLLSVIDIMSILVAVAAIVLTCIAVYTPCAKRSSSTSKDASQSLPHRAHRTAQPQASQKTPPTGTAAAMQQPHSSPHTTGSLDSQIR